MKHEKGSLNVGDSIEVEITKIVPRGLGLAFAQGCTIFVPLAAPGDRLTARVVETKANSVFAEIENIEIPSPVRIPPPCPYFGSCGGCDFQQMHYSAQLNAKVGIIRDCLDRIGKIENYGEIRVVPSPLEFGYRTRAQWHADIKQKTIGYFRRASHEVIDIEHCPILVPELDTKLQELRSNIEWDSISNNRIAVEAATGDDGSVSVYSAELIESTDQISAKIAGEKYEYSARSFFQGNRSIVESLVDCAIGGASGEKAVDLYSGVGLFTLPLARKFTRVTAVEDNFDAVDLAEINAEHGDLANISFVRDRVDRYVREARSDSADFVLLDPPRAGGSKDTIRNIARLGPSQISYVSCEPSILARDLRVLIDLGYTIESVTALDLFPQTHHVETVVRLSRT